MSMISGSYRKPNIVLFLFVLTYLLVLQWDNLDAFPLHIHAWAQIDRLAIAMGFQENQFNLFKPQSFVLNHQFPNHWMSEDKSPVTAVDFPIHEFLIAVIQSVVGMKMYSVFRVYNLFFAALGAFFIYQIHIKLSGNKFQSMLLSFFFLSSPIYAHYTGSLMSTIPALTLSIIGIYYYLNYLNDLKLRSLNLAILFMTISTLSRTSFAIPLIALILLEIFRQIRSRSFSVQLWLGPGIASAAIIAYAFYNHYLRMNYGSIFLSEPIPPPTFEDFIAYTSFIWNKWWSAYYTIWQYLWLIVIIVPGLWLHFKGKGLKMDDHLLFILIYLGGASLFSFLMLRQFMAHDYYFMDTFFLPSLLILSFCLKQFEVIEKRWFTIAINTSMALVIIFSSRESFAFHENRMQISCDQPVQNDYLNYSSANKLLDELNVPESAVLMCLSTTEPNLPYVLTGRYGYALMRTKKEEIRSALTWKFDYLLLENDFREKQPYLSDPNLLKGFELLGMNSHIAVYEKSENGGAITEPLKRIRELDISLGIENEQKFRFTSRDSGGLALIPPSQMYCLDLLSDQEKSISELNPKAIEIQMSFNMKRKGELLYLLEVSDENQRYYCKRIKLHEIYRQDQDWTEATLRFNLPEDIPKTAKFNAYMYNPGENEILISSLKLSYF